MVGHDDNDHNTKTNDEVSQEKADVLAFNLLVLSTLFWAIACCFWILMAYVTDPTTQQKENTTKNKNNNNNNMYECQNTAWKRMRVTEKGKGNTQVEISNESNSTHTASQLDSVAWHCR